MKPFLVIAYTTIGDYYEELSQNLEVSCKSNNIPLYLEKIESLGSWEKNTHYKSKFVKSCLNKFPNNNLAYVDVDAIFHKYPSFFDEIDTDISFRIENFRWRKNEPLSGTIYFKNIQEVHSLVDTWTELNEKTPAERKNPLTWEQFNMKKALDLNQKVKFQILPPEYCFITDHTRALYPGLIPIVEHFQASRQTTK